MLQDLPPKLAGPYVRVRLPIFVELPQTAGPPKHHGYGQLVFTTRLIKDDWRQVMAANDYAVVVGINRYEGLNHLRGPENDAADFDAWLRKPTGGAVPGGNIARLLGSDLDAGSLRPRVGDIDDEFGRLHAGLRSGTAGRTGRRLYIFLAGHGFDPDGTDAALLCASATRRRLGDHISGKLYSLWFRKAALFDEIALFMDCCRDDYSGAPLRPPPWREENRPDPNVRMFTALATRWAFQARERVDAEDPGLRVRGLFSKALLSTLNAGEVTGEELKRFTINGLAELVGEDDYPGAGDQRRSWFRVQ